MNKEISVLHYLGQLLAEVSGPFRLLTSFLFLASLGGALGFLLTFGLLPKVWKFAILLKVEAPLSGFRTESSP